MTLADTSAWVEYTRDRRTNVADRLEAMVRDRTVVVTEPVVMEVLAGARNREHARGLDAMLGGIPTLAVGGLGAWESAAHLYRACRHKGITIRSQLDCLIAAVAIREDVPVLHADRDFDLIAQHTPLRVVAV